MKRLICSLFLNALLAAGLALFLSTESPEIPEALRDISLSLRPLPETAPVSLPEAVPAPSPAAPEVPPPEPAEPVPDPAADPFPVEEPPPALPRSDDPADRPVAAAAEKTGPVETAVLPPAEPAPPVCGETLDYKRLVLEAIGRSKIYPSGARSRNQEGSVRVKLVINRKGKLEECLILESSGFALLDKGALKSVQRAAPFPDLPAGEEEMIIRFYMDFELN